MGEGVAANRGALPFHKLSKAQVPPRVLVPLAPGEALWVAWFVQSGIEVVGRTARGETLRITPIGAAHGGWALLAADAVETAEGPRPIDASTITLAEAPAALQCDHLTFRVSDNTGHVSGGVSVVLGAPAFYQSVSGLPAPPPTSPADAYGGWRLP